MNKEFLSMLNIKDESELDAVDWDYISSRQTLSEPFIREFSDRVDWSNISSNQTLSEEFRMEFHCPLPANSWLNLGVEDKREKIEACGLYEVDGDCVIAYKSTLKGGRSVFKPGIRYEVGGIYDAKCDFNSDVQDSFGLSAWTSSGAKDYCGIGDLYEVRVRIEDVGALVHGGNKLRCKRIEVVRKID